ncbi:MAG: HAD family hydrolase [Deltaproteobacteria bacterium]|nr:HAD family hydrolase [Deltaproteobacteria bacterium]MBW2207671.1 HAD family hydrolase [Deltaproteobacteria bacterium]
MGLMLSISSRKVEASGIFFDKDGTLVDLQYQFSQLMEGRLRFILPRLKGDGRSIQGEIATAVGYDPGTGKVHPNGALGHSTRAETMGIVSGVLEKQGYERDSAQEIARGAFDEADQALPLDTLIKPTHGALTLLAALKDQGTPLACLTNDMRRRTERALELLGVRDYFDIILGADDSETPKPDPQIFLKACRSLNLDPREVVMVGDSSDDMEMARRAGAGLAVRIVSEDEGVDDLPSEGLEIHIRKLDEILIFRKNGGPQTFKR